MDTDTRRAVLLADQAQACLLAGDAEGAQARIYDALQIALSHDDPDVVQRCHVLRAAAELAAGHVDGARTYLEKAIFLFGRHGRDHSKVLAMLTRVLDEGTDVDRILRSALELMAREVRAERGFLLLLDEGGGMSFSAAFNMAVHEDPELSTSVVERAIVGGGPVLVEDARSETARSIERLGLTSILAVPIASSRRVIGAVYLDTRSFERRFTQDDVELLSAFAQRIARPLEQSARIARLENLLEKKYGLAGIVGVSPAMKRVFELIEKVLPVSYPIVLEGETGTGKELVARAIHFNGPRKGRAFVPVNCAALSESLLESELFGHVRGAFTGAESDKAGLFEHAHGGTLLLDEVEEMSLGMQKKLLRILEDRQVRRVGGNDSTTVDVRIIAATNKSLKALAEEGQFRQDLYYRLSAVTILLPPLRERVEDIPVLIEHLLDQIAQEVGSKPQISSAAGRKLAAHAWPGNVRELKNELRRLALSSSGVVTEAALSESVRASKSEIRGKYREVLEESEREVLKKALEENQWNVSAAARALGWDRHTVKRKMTKYKL